jgi:ribosome-associated protein
MVRKPRDERAANRPPAAYREIFKVLRQLDAAQAKPTADADGGATDDTDTEPT